MAGYACCSGSQHKTAIAVLAGPEDNDNRDFLLSDLQRILTDALKSHQQQLQAWTDRQDAQWTHLLDRQDRLEQLLEGLAARSPSSIGPTGLLAAGRGLGGAALDDDCWSPASPTLAQTADDREPPGSTFEAVHSLLRASSAKAGLDRPDSPRTALTKDLVKVDARSHWRGMVRKAAIRLHRKGAKPLGNTGELTGLRRVVRSRYYEFSVIFMVVMNTLFIGLQTQYAAMHRHPPAFEAISENVFCVIFFLELMVRFRAEGLNFFISKDWAWNLFDSVVVLAMVAEQVLRVVFDDAFEQLSTISMLRIMRVIRIVRVLRITRVLKFFRELRMMITSILRSAKSLIWVFLILSVLFYIFGISLVQGVVAFCDSQDKWESSDTAALRDSFGSLDRSFLALFEAMSGGISWGELLDSLKPLPVIYSIIFLTYVAFAIFGVVNIVTGVFVENAMQSGIFDRDTLVQEEMLEKEQYVERIKVCFEELDIDKNGCIGLDEFKEAVSDSKMVALINALGLDITDVQSLFILLDRDQSGSIDIEEFLVGCLRLKGEARSLDIAKMQIEVEFLVHAVDNIASNVKAIRLGANRPVNRHGLRTLGSKVGT